jgi:hypothetical protein
LFFVESLADEGFWVVFSILELDLEVKIEKSNRALETLLKG